MGEVVKFYKRNAAIDPNAVLENAIDQYESVVVIGYDHDGGLSVRGSLNLQAKDILFMVESFKYKLINGDYFEEDE